MLIKNARVIDPAQNLDENLDVLVDGSLIKEIGKNICADTVSSDVFDAKGLILAPSFFDAHVHFRDFDESYKETYETGAVAALKGGYTACVAMANTKPPIDSKERLRDAKERVRNLPIDILLSANITKNLEGQEINNLQELIDSGAKCLTDDGFPVLNEKIMIEALKFSEKTGIPISLHEEDPKYILHSGYDDTAPREAEISILKRDLDLVRKYGGWVNVQHLSSKEGVELIKMAKNDGLNVTAEVTPNHIFFTNKDVENYGTLLKVNPPIRTEEDRDTLREALKDGIIDMIATDHAPHSYEDKNLGKYKSKSGILSIETAFSLAIMSLYETGVMRLMDIIRVLSTKPRQLYGYEREIKVGQRADLVLLNPDKIYTYKVSVSRSQNSPLIGKKLKGQVLLTMKDGHILYNDIKEVK